MKKLSLFIGFLILALFAVKSSYASYGSVACQPIYGGGQTCATTDKIILDKKVLDPSSKTKGKIDSYVDNLSVNDGKYFPSQHVKFQITLTNVSNSTLSEITVTDMLPNYIDFVSGAGTYDKSTKTLTFKVVNLNSNETRKYIIDTKVVDASKLPNGQGMICNIVNQASAVVKDSEAKDNSQFCIEKTVATTKGGLPVMPAPKMSQTPATGPEMLPLFGLIPAAIGGLILRRKSK
ncbi:MAG: hypothetical protein AAB520_00010 [Patescibacteria group bacterium]